MLTPTYLATISDSLTPHIQKLENDLIKHIAELIKRGVVADYEIETMLEMGYKIQDIERELNKEIDNVTAAMEKTIEAGIKKSYDIDVELYKQGGKELTNKAIINQMESYAERSLNDFKNLSKTKGFIYNGQFKRPNDYIYSVLNESIFKVTSGVISYDDAIKSALIHLGNDGVRFMDYESGRRLSIESAVRSNLLTTLNQVTGRMSEMNADEMEQDLMQITAHAGARPSHQVWQGDIVSRSGKRGYLDLTDIGYGDSAGFMGVNCRHNWYPYFEGISQDIPIEKDNPPIEYEGEILTHYDCTQVQRAMERNMRKTIRKVKAFEGSGDSKNLTIQKIRLQEQKSKYKDFSKRANIRPKWNRLVT